MLQVLENFLDQETTRIIVRFTVVFLVAITYISILAYMIKRRNIFPEMIRIFRPFFYSERFFGTLTSSGEPQMQELIEKVKSLEDDWKRIKLPGLDAEFEAASKSFLDENFSAQLGERIADQDQIENSVVAHLNERIDKNVREFLTNKDISEITQEIVSLRELERKDEQLRQLDKILDFQMTSAGRLKTVMINLFIVFNISVMLSLFYIARSANQGLLSLDPYYGLLGIYISLATFIFYIYRSSNNRSAVVMAIRENAYNLIQAREYLDRYASTGSVSENDATLVRLLLTNRSEREKQAKHPYEIVLQGVSDSNILLKGGKVTIDKQATKSK